MPRMSREQSGLRFGFNPVVEPNVVSGEFNGHSELPRTPNTTSTEIGQARRPAPRWRSVAEEAPGLRAGPFPPHPGIWRHYRVIDHRSSDPQLMSWQRRL